MIMSHHILWILCILAVSEQREVVDRSGLVNNLSGSKMNGCKGLWCKSCCCLPTLITAYAKGVAVNNQAPNKLLYMLMFLCLCGSHVFMLLSRSVFPKLQRKVCVFMSFLYWAKLTKLMIILYFQQATRASKLLPTPAAVTLELLLVTLINSQVSPYTPRPERREVKRRSLLHVL